MENYLLISDAAREVQVESHVLRYWEEELHLPIKRNELGHRYYTQEDVERFRQIKSMKERGLQLKAIKMVLKDGKLDVISQENAPESREEKAQRLQWIMQQLIRQAVQENNAELVRQIKESVLKELDYQFRMQDEREEERAKQAAERTEAYYRQLDELLRKKSARKKLGQLFSRSAEKRTEGDKPKQPNKVKVLKEKKKRHFVV